MKKLRIDFTSIKYILLFSGVISTCKARHDPSEFKDLKPIHYFIDLSIIERISGSVALTEKLGSGSYEVDFPFQLELADLALKKWSELTVEGDSKTFSLLWQKQKNLETFAVLNVQNSTISDKEKVAVKKQLDGLGIDYNNHTFLYDQTPRPKTKLYVVSPLFEKGKYFRHVCPDADIENEICLCDVPQTNLLEKKPTTVLSLGSKDKYLSISFNTVESYRGVSFDYQVKKFDPKGD